MKKDSAINLKDFTKSELKHALETLKKNSPEENGKLLEVLGYTIVEELWNISEKS